MNTRRERQEAYTDGGGLKPLSWGRLKIAQRALDGAPDESAGDIAAILFLLPYKELKAIPLDKLQTRAESFAEELDAKTVIECANALARDVAAIEASQTGGAGESKEGQGVERSRPLNPESSQQVSA